MKINNDIKGRGSSSNPSNRFEKLHYANENESDGWLDSGFVDEFTGETERPLLRTEFFRDTTKSIVTENKSPDLPFEFSVNPYRGCEHGCAYCYARPTHEYLGYSAGLDFESKIFVKDTAPQLLREKLMSRSWKGSPIFFSGITDCYQPVERKLKLTRQCLQVMAEFKNPASIITKNVLVTRDIEILKELASFNGVVVFLSITTLDTELCRFLEPRTSHPESRIKAIELLAKNGIPVGVNVAPCIPGLTDHEMPAIMKAAADAGAEFAGYTPLRLPLTVLPVFTEWLEAHRPDRKDKILSAIKDIRGGKLNDARFGSRMRGEGARADNMEQMFEIYTRREKLNVRKISLSSDHFIRPGDQLTLFDE